MAIQMKTAWVLREIYVTKPVSQESLAYCV